MAVSQAPADLEQPLSIAMTAFAGQTDGEATQGALNVTELAAEPGTNNQRFVAVMASSLQSPPNSVQEELAVQAVISTVELGGNPHLAEQMKTAFRDANRAIYEAIRAGDEAEANADGVAMLALLTNGKYATLGLVGHDRAYLVRARRLTQLTRDQRVERACSRRKRDIEEQAATSAAPQSVRLLGEGERLDTRSPAIFEITLLPDDRLALLSHELVDLLGEERIMAALEAGAAGGMASLIGDDQRGDRGHLLAAVLEVAASREAPAPLPVAATRPGTLLWATLLLLVVVLLIAAGLVLVVL